MDYSAAKTIDENLLDIVKKIEKYKDYRYTIYEMVDANGIVRYIGRTRQELAVRETQHHRSDPKNKGKLTIQKAERNGCVLENLHYEEARGLEQIVFDDHGGKAAAKAKHLVNINNPLNTKSKEGKIFYEIAQNFLDTVKKAF